MEFNFSKPKVLWKRWISLLLVALLCVSTVDITAFATDDVGTENVGKSNMYDGDVTGNANEILSIAKEISEGKVYESNITDGTKSAYFQFTTEVSKTYSINVDGSTECPFWIYDVSEIENRRPKCVASEVWECYQSAFTKGRTYLIRVQLSNPEETGTVRVSMEEVEVEFGSDNVFYGDVTGNAAEIGEKAKEIGLNTNEKTKINTEGLAGFHKFTPTETGIYSVSASSADKSSTVKINLYNFDEVGGTEDGEKVLFGYGENEIPQVLLKAGTTYLIRTRIVEEKVDEEGGSYTEPVSGALTLKVTKASVETVSEESPIKLYDEGKSCVAFTPSETATYYVYAEGKEGEIAGFIYNSNGECVGNGSVDFWDVTPWNNISAKLNKDETYYFFWTSYDCDAENVTISRKPLDLDGDLQVTDNQIQCERNRYTRFRFIAPETGKYHIYRKDHQEFAVYWEDDEQEEYYSCTNGVNRDFQAGEICYISFWVGERETKNKVITIEKTETTEDASGSTEKQYRQIWFPEKITVGIDSATSFVYGVPKGVEVTSKESSIAKAEVVDNYSGGYDLQIKGISVGHTVVTVSMPGDDEYYDFECGIPVEVTKYKTSTGDRNVRIGEAFYLLEKARYKDVQCEITSGEDVIELRTDDSYLSYDTKKPGTAIVHITAKGKDDTVEDIDDNILISVRKAEFSFDDNNKWRGITRSVSGVENIQLGFENYDGEVSDLSVDSSNPNVATGEIIKENGVYYLKYTPGSESGITKFTISTKETDNYVESSVVFALTLQVSGENLECTHDNLEEEITTATCEDSWVKKITKCADCGYIIATAYEEWKETHHEFDSEKEIIKKEATGCVYTSGYGVRSRYCTNCNCWYEECYYLEHEFEETVFEPTCEREGYTAEVCKYCHDDFDSWDWTQPFGHVYSEEDVKVIKEPTCGTTGRKEITCNRCGKVRILSTPATEKHEFAEVTNKDGSIISVCKNCGVYDSAPGENSYLKNEVLYIGDKQYIRLDIQSENPEQLDFSSEDVMEFADFRGEWIEVGNDFTFTLNGQDGYSVEYLGAGNYYSEDGEWWKIKKRADGRYKVDADKIKKGFYLSVECVQDEEIQATESIQNVKAERTDDGILLTWDAVTDASEYTIEYAYYVDDLLMFENVGYVGTVNENKFLYSNEQMAEDGFADDDVEHSYRFVVKTIDQKAEGNIYFIASVGTPSDGTFSTMLDDLTHFAGENYVAAGDQISDEIVYNYTRSIYHLYTDSKKLTYNLSYDSFMEKVDSLFVNHSDMKDYLRSTREYDEENDLVKLELLDDEFDSKYCEYIGYKVNGATYTVYGRWLHYIEEDEITEDMVKDQDYVEHTAINESGEVCAVYYRIGDSVTATFSRNEEGSLRVVSYESTENQSGYIQNGRLYKDGKTYVGLSIKYPVSGSAEVQSEEIYSFDGIDGSWIECGKAFKFTVDAKTDYEIENVLLGDSVLKKGEDGTYLITKDMTESALTITVNVHVWNDGEVTKKATCTEKGEKTYTCTKCGDTKVEETAIDSENHTPGEAVEENRVESTCTKKGSYDNVIYCSECQTEISRTSHTIEIKPHTEIILPRVEPTCTKTGLTEGKKCSVCKEVYEEQQTIPALGHVKAELEGTDPTCVAPGKTAGTHCSRCLAVLSEQERIAPTGIHTWEGDKCTVCQAQKPEATEATIETKNGEVSVQLETITMDAQAEAKVSNQVAEADVSDAKQVAENTSVDVSKVLENAQDITKTEDVIKTLDLSKAESGEVTVTVTQSVTMEVNVLEYNKNEEDSLKSIKLDVTPIVSTTVVATQKQGNEEVTVDTTTSVECVSELKANTSIPVTIVISDEQDEDKFADVGDVVYIILVHNEKPYPFKATVEEKDGKLIAQFDNNIGFSTVQLSKEKVQPVFVWNGKQCSVTIDGALVDADKVSITEKVIQEPNNKTPGKKVYVATLDEMYNEVVEPKFMTDESAPFEYQIVPEFKWNGAQCTVKIDGEEVPSKDIKITEKIIRQPNCLTTGKKVYIATLGDEYEGIVTTMTSENTVEIPKLKAQMSVNATSLVLKTKQKTTAFKVYGLGSGDYVQSWRSSNTKIFTVAGRSNGTCTIKAGSKTGSAWLTVTLASGLTKNIKVKVQKKTVGVSSIKGLPRTITIKKGQSYSLKPSVYPITASQKVSYSTSSKKVAKVSRGVIKGVKAGKATITVKAGKKKVKIKVIVK